MCQKPQKKTCWDYKNHVTRQCNIRGGFADTRIATCFQRLIHLYVHPSTALSPDSSSFTINGSSSISVYAFSHFRRFVTRNARVSSSPHAQWTLRIFLMLRYTILFSRLWQFVSKFRLINGVKKERRKYNREKRTTVRDAPGEIVLRLEDSVS